MAKALVGDGDDLTSYGHDFGDGDERAQGCGFDHSGDQVDRSGSHPAYRLGDDDTKVEVGGCQSQSSPGFVLMAGDGGDRAPMSSGFASAAYTLFSVVVKSSWKNPSGSVPVDLFIDPVQEGLVALLWCVRMRVPFSVDNYLYVGMADER